jgi:hypothetical protein
MAEDIKAENPIAISINKIISSSMQYDPNLGRTFLPASRMSEVKLLLLDVITQHLAQSAAKIKQELSTVKVQEMEPSKHYFISMPKDCDPRDVEDLMKVIELVEKDHPDMNPIHLVLSRGVEIDEVKNGAIMSNLMDMLKGELDTLIKNGRTDQISAIDTAMSDGNAKTVVEIENKMAHQRWAYMHALESVRLAFDRLGKKLTEKYYIVDKADIKK